MPLEKSGNIRADGGYISFVILADDHSCAITFGPDKPEKYAMIRILRFVDEQRWWPVSIKNDNVQVAIVIDIAKCDSPAGLQGEVV